MRKKVKLFHVSFNITEPLDKIFIPRVPENLMNGEDEIYKRICKFCDGRYKEHLKKLYAYKYRVCSSFHAKKKV